MKTIIENIHMANPTPYSDLNEVLRELVESVQAVLMDNFLGAYLQGSFAVGDFDRHSDVDFIIAIQEELSQEQVQALQSMHARIYALNWSWAQHLEGSYFPKHLLKDFTQRGTPLWYIDNGSQSIERSMHDNTILVRRVVQAYGIALLGPDPATLVDPIPVDALRQEMLESMNNWGNNILADPQIINNRFYQTFAVLHYCRVLHDMHTGVPGSKRAGSEWAKANLEPSWIGLIDCAWYGRPSPEISVRQPANPDDLKSTVEFIQYIMGLVVK